MSADDAERDADAAAAVPDDPAASQALEVPEVILNPVTGELVPTSDGLKIALAVDSIRLAKRDLDKLIGDFTDAAVAISRREGTRTFSFPGLTASLSPDSEIEWDFELLERRLLAAGCPQGQIDKLIKTKVEYRVDGTVARQFAAANAAYKDAIEASKRRVPKRVYLSIKPT